MYTYIYLSIYLSIYLHVYIYIYTQVYGVSNPQYRYSIYLSQHRVYTKPLFIYAEAGLSPGAALVEVAEIEIQNTYGTCPVHTFGYAGAYLAKQGQLSGFQLFNLTARSRFFA